MIWWEWLLVGVGLFLVLCVLGAAINDDDTEDFGDDARFAADWQADMLEQEMGSTISEEARRKKALQWERRMRDGARPFGPTQADRNKSR